MNKEQKIKLVGILQDLAGLPRYKIGKESICFVCHSNSQSGMTFHHLWYYKGEKNYKDFTNRLEYYEYLAPLIQQTPERFLYVHNKCHQAITRLHRWKPIKRNRLIKAVRMTR